MALDKITFIVSTEELDRDGDRMIIDGLDSKNFEKNPVGYYNHFRAVAPWWSGDSKNSEITPIVRWENIRVEMMDLNGKNQKVLLADAIFDEEDEFSMKIYKKVQGKFINTASIGFMPKTWSVKPEDQLPGQDGLTFMEWELWEISVVDIPSNSSATVIRSTTEDGKEELKTFNEKADLKKAISEKNTEIAYVCKSFSGTYSNFNVKNNLKTESVMEKSFGKRILEAIQKAFSGKGIELKNAEGKNLTEKELETLGESLSDIKNEIDQVAIEEAVEKATEKFDEKIKELGGQMAKVAMKEAGLSDLEKEVTELKKSLEEQTGKVKSLVKEFAAIKTNKSGGEGSGKGDKGAIETDDSEEGDEMLKGNASYQQLIEWKKQGFLKEAAFQVEVKKLKETVK